MVNFISIWYFSLFLVFASCSKMNVPRVLLPWFDDISINFTLQVEDNGCYRWTVSRDDVIQLIPINMNPVLGCSSSVTVSSITKEAKRNTVIVFAEEINSKQVIPCDVIVDVIHSLKVLTRTRELYVQEYPEVFEITAHDDQDNAFTTLEGVEMDWTVAHLSSQGALRLLLFKNSPYATPASVSRFDELGIHGHIVLLEGTKTGSTKVSVRLSHREYSNLPPLEVQLMVIANLIIDPPVVYLMPGDSIRYRVREVRHGRLRDIELPSPQYHLEVADTDIAVMHETNSEAQGLKIGQTKVILRDLNVDPNESGLRIPTAILHVALPAFLQLSLLPHRNWAVLVEDKHTVAVEVYDKSHHKFSGDGMHVKVTIPPKLFHVEFKTNNGTYHAGWGLKPGTARVDAVLEGVVSSSGEKYPLKEIVTGQEDLLIYPRMEIHPKEIVLPWDPYSLSGYEVKLRCKGGDGSLLWSSLNTSVAVVNQEGLVRTHGLGQSNVSASMTVNQHNRAFASVRVLPPSHLEILDYVLEADVDSPIYLQIAVYAQNPTGARKLPFTKCHQLPFKVTIWEENFVYDEKLKATPTGDACATVAVIGKSPGPSQVTVSYEEGGLLLTSSVVVAAYKPLTVLEPASGETVLALGTSRNLIFVGGPRPWPGRGAEHGKTIQIGEGTKTEKEMVEITELSNKSEDRDMYPFAVLCRVIGETTVTLTVYNDAGSGRVESSANVKVFCAKPRFASLQAVLSVEENASCPMNVNADRVAVQSSDPVKLELRITDIHGRSFDNVSSLLMEWTAKPSTPTWFQHKDGVAIETRSVKGIKQPVRCLQMVQAEGETGPVDVTVRLTGYRSSVLRSKQITAEWPSFGVKNDQGVVVAPDIRATLGLLFVSDTLVSPNKTTLFNHPHSVLTLLVSQGSGHFLPQLENQDVISVQYSKNSRTLEIHPATTGVAHFGLIDLCLPSRPAVVTVIVVGVESLLVDVPDRLQLGQRALCVVHITDTMGNPLDLADLSLLELQPRLEETKSRILSIKEYVSDKDLDRELGITGPAQTGEFRFLIDGLALGDANIYFTTGHGSYEVRSSVVNVQVFNPLRLSPRNVTLLVGSHILLKSHGGPSTGSLREFSATSPGIVEVSDVGVIKGLRVGHTRITAQAIGSNKITGNSIVFSEDAIDVYVIPLTGIQLRSPIVGLKRGAVMPVWAFGIPEALSPLVIGAMKPPLHFEWSLSSMEVGELHDVFEDTGIEITNHHRVSMRFKALSAGQTTITVSVIVPPEVAGTSEERIFTESLQVEVFKEFHLTNPVLLADRDFSGILIAPETEIQLRTNFDGMAEVQYSLQGYTSTSGEERHPSIRQSGSQHTSILSLSPTGLITSHSMHGRTSVIVSTKETSSIMKQTLGLSIEVKPVEYIMVNVKSNLLVTPGVSVATLPKGLDLQLEVTYHDNTGMAFTATHTDIKMDVSRGDLVQLDRITSPEKSSANSSLKVGLLHVGDTVLRIVDERTPSHAADYVVFPVEDFIFPSEKKVTVGDMIFFSLPLETRDGKTGSWSTDSPDVVSLNSGTGLGHAKQPGGPLLVKYTLENHVLSSMKIEVMPIQSMVFSNSLDGYLVNADAGSSSYRVGLVLKGDHEDLKQSNLISRNKIKAPLDSIKDFYTSLPFTCEARFNSHGITTQILEVFHVRPLFDSSSGLYACELTPTGKLTEDIARLETNVTLRARAASWAGDAVSAPLVLPFLPAVFVSTAEVVFLGGSPGQLLVVGVPEVLSQISVEIVNDAMVYVSDPEYASETSRIFYITLTNKFWAQPAVNELKDIYVVSPSTKQNVKIPLKLQLDSGQLTAPFVIPHIGVWIDVAYFHRHTLVLASSLIVILLGLCYAYSTYIHPILRPSQDQFFLAGATTSPSPNYLVYPSSASSSPANISHNRSLAFSDSEPVYGDPRWYAESPNPRQRHFR